MTSELTIPLTLEEAANVVASYGAGYHGLAPILARQLLATMQENAKLLAECDKHVLKVANIAIENRRLRVALDYALHFVRMRYHSTSIRDRPRRRSGVDSRPTGLPCGLRESPFRGPTGSHAARASNTTTQTLLRISDIPTPPFQFGYRIGR